MKILVLGDTHGSTAWKEIVKQPHDKVIFVGDYFDTHGTATALQQIRNFINILEFKKSHDKPVVLLVGNHDFHYLPCAGEDRYSGFQSAHWESIQEILVKALSEDLMQMCHQEGVFLFSHAGITNTWSDAFGIDTMNPAESINKAFKERPEIFKFYRKDSSNCGDHPMQSPIWVRPASLGHDNLDGYKQVVGHTRMKSMMLGTLSFIDTIETSEEYLTVTTKDYETTLTISKIHDNDED
jgi:predicted phosphodiesterase